MELQNLSNRTTLATRGKLASTLVGLALILLLAAQPAWAHGGGEPQLTNAEAGAYLISVWTEPETLEVGEMHVTVAVSELPAPGTAQVGDPVLDATVRVQANRVDQTGETLSAVATHEAAANKLFYEAVLELPSDGTWQVEILVDGPAGSGSAGFEVQVSPVSEFSLITIGGGALALLIVGWLFYRSQSRVSGD